MTKQEIDELRKLCMYALETRQEIVKRITEWLDHKEAEMSARRESYGRYLIEMISPENRGNPLPRFEDWQAAQK